MCSRQVTQRRTLPQKSARTKTGATARKPPDMTRPLKAEPLTAAAFAPYGDVIDVAGAPDKLINRGM